MEIACNELPALVQHCDLLNVKNVYLAYIDILKYLWEDSVNHSPKNLVKSEQHQDAKRTTHPVIQCIADKNLEELKEMLQKYDVNGLYPCADWEDDITPLCAAAAYGTEDICKHLLKVEADPNIYSTQGLTPLLYCIKVNVSVDIITLLLQGKANPNLGYPTPLALVTVFNRKDIAKELLKSGAVPELNYILKPLTAKSLFNMLCGLSLETDQMKKYLLFFNFFCDLQKMKPEEIFNQYHQHFLEMHPSMQVTILDVLFTIGHYDLVYRRMVIKWLKDTPNLARYVEETIKHFPTIAAIQSIVVRNLDIAFGKEVEIPQLWIDSLLPILLDCLEKSMTCSPDDILQLLHTIIHKQDNISDTDLIERLCKGIIPFRDLGHSTGAITWEILAHLCSYNESLPGIITSLGVTSVPECMLDTADETSNTRKLSKRLMQLSDSQRRTTVEYDNTQLSVEAVDHSSVRPLPDKHTYIVVEVCRYNLEEFLHLSEDPQLKEIVEQLLKALKSIHRNNMFHGDLRLQNVLIGKRLTTTFI